MDNFLTFFLFVTDSYKLARVISQIFTVMISIHVILIKFCNHESYIFKVGHEDGILSFSCSWLITAFETWVARRGLLVEQIFPLDTSEFVPGFEYCFSQLLVFFVVLTCHCLYLLLFFVLSLFVDWRLLITPVIVIKPFYLHISGLLRACIFPLWLSFHMTLFSKKSLKIPKG